MSEENKAKQTAIVIGAGANADFRLQNGQDLIAEIQAVPNNGIQRVIKPKFTLEDSSISMPTGEQLVKKIADENELIKSVCFLFFEKFISAKNKQLDQSTLTLRTNSMCEFFFSSKNPEPSPSILTAGMELFLDRWQKQYAADSEMLAIGTFVYQMLSEIPEKERKSGIKQIKDSITEKIKNDYSHYFELSEIVRYYQPFSIDELLNSIQNEKISTIREGSFNSKKELVEAGKVLIANYLLQAENKKTFQDFDSVCWYRHLRNMIVTSGKNRDEICEKIKQLTIISFNYDRSLDYFLREKLGQFYEDLKQRIIYPYGDLLEAESNKNSFSKVPYGFLRDKNSFSEHHGKGKIFESAERIYKNLQIIGEIKDSKKEEIRSIIRQANNLYFMGFSFNQENCEVLGLVNKDVKSNFYQFGSFTYYTNFRDSKKIEEKFNKIFNISSQNGQTKVSHKGVYDALAEDFDLHL